MSHSFTFKKETSATLAHFNESVQMSVSVPAMAPFNIDFNAIRRAYSQLFAIPNEKVLDQLERVIDLSIKTLCFSVRMILKKADTAEHELDKIMHALLVVNELPMLEDPKYMDDCAKMFYATMSELPSAASVKIVRLWSRWHGDELRIFLNRMQQYITVCIISKDLGDESNRNNEDDDDESGNESDRNRLHKHEGLTGAVGCMKLIYYASVLGKLTLRYF